jgi:hypothetical protein
MGFKGMRFATIEDIERDGRTAEDSKEAFHRCFQQWQDR